MEMLVSLLAACCVFCVVLSLAEARGRRRAALRMVGDVRMTRQPPFHAISYHDILWKLLDRLGRPSHRPADAVDEDLVRELGPGWTARRFRGARRFCGLALCLPLLPLGLPSLPALPLAYLAGNRLPPLWLRRRRQRATEALGSDLPEVVDLLAVLCYAGESLQRSLLHSIHIAQHPRTRLELEEVAEGLRLGEGLGEALRRVADHPCRELRRLARTLMRAEESGAPVSEVLSQLATEMRSARKERSRVRAARVSVMVLFPLVFMILPSFLLLTVGSMIIGRVL